MFCTSVFVCVHTYACVCIYSYSYILIDKFACHSHQSISCYFIQGVMAARYTREVVLQMLDHGGSVTEYNSESEISIVQEMLATYISNSSKWARINQTQKIRPVSPLRKKVMFKSLQTEWGALIRGSTKCHVIEKKMFEYVPNVKKWKNKNESNVKSFLCVQYKTKQWLFLTKMREMALERIDSNTGHFRPTYGRV